MNSVTDRVTNVKSIADRVNDWLYKGRKVRTAITVRNVIHEDMRSRGENRKRVPWASAEQVNKMVDGDKNHPYYGSSEKQIVIMHSKQDEFLIGGKRVDDESIADLINGKLYKGSKVRTADAVRAVRYRDMRSRGDSVWKRERGGVFFGFFQKR